MAHGSAPAPRSTLDSRWLLLVVKNETELSSGLTMPTMASSSVMAMVPDFDGRFAIAGGVTSMSSLVGGLDGHATSPMTTAPSNEPPSEILKRVDFMLRLLRIER